MEAITRLWGVLDYGLAGLTQEESENANKDIVQAIKDIDTLKAKAELFDEATLLLDVCRMGFDAVIDDYENTNDIAKASLLQRNVGYIDTFLSKAKDLK